MYRGKIITIAAITAIPKKDRILLASLVEIPGLQVIVGLDVKPGDVMAYFPENVQLSEPFCAANDLYEKDLGGGKRSGYFDHKRRVKILRLGGVRSEGVLFPLSHFSYLPGWHNQESNNLFVPGYEFDKIDGHEICRKYRVRHPSQPAKKKTKWEKIKQWWRDRKSAKNYYDAWDSFERHPDTEQLRNYISTIPIGAQIILTEKIHGQLAKTGKVKILPWYKRLLEYLNPLPMSELFTDHELMVGTREIVLNSKGFYKMEYRKHLAEKFAGCKIGEDFTYEVAGYITPEVPVQRFRFGRLKGKYDLSSLKLTGEESQAYSYDCKPGECKEFVYRLDVVERGFRQTLGWDVTVTRCKELGLTTVPELERFTHVSVEDTLARANGWLANDVVKPSTVDASHIIEGICLRVEDIDQFGVVKSGWQVFKHKSFIFGMLEGYNLEADIEEEN